MGTIILVHITQVKIMQKKIKNKKITIGIQCTIVIITHSGILWKLIRTMKYLI